VLGRIERDGPSSASSLARAEGMRPQSMAAIITALESAGLIVGAADPRDGRKTLWSLTEKAREEYRTGRRAKEDWLAQAIGATLTADEVERLAASIDLLRKLARA
jgi:DNA-binding MarR family transcriptional regulator